MSSYAENKYKNYKSALDDMIDNEYSRLPKEVSKSIIKSKIVLERLELARSRTDSSIATLIDMNRINTRMLDMKRRYKSQIMDLSSMLSDSASSYSNMLELIANMRAK